MIQFVATCWYSIVQKKENCCFANITASVPSKSTKDQIFTPPLLSSAEVAHLVDNYVIPNPKVQMSESCWVCVGCGNSNPPSAGRCLNGGCGVERLQENVACSVVRKAAIVESRREAAERLHQKLKEAKGKVGEKGSKQKNPFARRSGRKKGSKNALLRMTEI